ncbi:hypothetical protein SAMN04488063_3347 [Halopelagius inordinatus]|uniref:DUF7344 domain-containing protein n=1 Tax=Halopelagius inordinatus TaxID=553467 RepID=A0A1I2VUF1_9EURY|nr:hypothetical protein SAMN04488063_3347 [Halopelagius inordinatus]
MEETEAFRVLGSADRQLLLYELIHSDRGVSEERLARRVAAYRHRSPPESVGSEQVERAHIRLVHVHLPLLRRLDVVERDGDQVTLTDNRSRDQLLEAAAELDGWPPDDLLRLPFS